MAERELTPLSDYTLPHFDFPDPKMSAFVADIDWMLRAVKENRMGPYGALEGIAGALYQFAEDWNE